LFTFTLNIPFFAVAARHSDQIQTSDEARLPPLQTSVSILPSTT